MKKVLVTMVCACIVLQAFAKENCIKKANRCQGFLSICEIIYKRGGYDSKTGWEAPS